MANNSQVVKSPFPDINIPDVSVHELAFKKFEIYGRKTALVSISSMYDFLSFRSDS